MLETGRDQLSLSTVEVVFARQETVAEERSRELQAAALDEVGRVLDENRLREVAGADEHHRKVGEAHAADVAVLDHELHLPGEALVAKLQQVTER